MARELWDIEDIAMESLREWFENNPDLRDDDDAIGEAIWEAADNAVPVYTADLLQCALDNLWLAREEPEMETERNAVAIISANLFDHLREKLHEGIDDLRAEFEIEDEVEDEDGITIHPAIYVRGDSAYHWGLLEGWITLDQQNNPDKIRGEII